MGNWTVFNITAMGDVRRVASDKWKKRDNVQRLYAYRNELKLLANVDGIVLGHRYQVVFEIPMPSSWSKKKRKAKALTPHDQKPDIDNLVKAFQDTLSKEDKAVYNVDGYKFWTDKAEGRILVRNLDDIDYGNVVGISLGD